MLASLNCSTRSTLDQRFTQIIVEINTWFHTALFCWSVEDGTKRRRGEGAVDLAGSVYSRSSSHYWNCVISSRPRRLLYFDALASPAQRRRVLKQQGASANNWQNRAQLPPPPLTLFQWRWGCFEIPSGTDSVLMLIAMSVRALAALVCLPLLSMVVDSAHIFRSLWHVFLAAEFRGAAINSEWPRVLLLLLTI